MKKQIPKFDQKAWDEKQAKSAENYSKNEKGFTSGSFVPTAGEYLFRSGHRAGKSQFHNMIKDLTDRVIIPCSKPSRSDQLDALDYLTKSLPGVQYIPKGYISIDPSGNGGTALTPSVTTTSSYNPTTGVWTLGDDFDQHLFDGGEDGERLPQGQGSLYGWLDPASEAVVKCCQPEHRINIGFAHDKWACKICGKDME